MRHFFVCDEVPGLAFVLAEVGEGWLLEHVTQDLGRPLSELELANRFPEVLAAWRSRDETARQAANEILAEREAEEDAQAAIDWAPYLEGRRSVPGPDHLRPVPSV